MEAGAGGIQETEAGPEVPETAEVISATARACAGTPATRATGPVTGTIPRLQSMLPILPLGKFTSNISFGDAIIF